MDQLYSPELKDAIHSERVAPSELPRPEGFETWAPFLQLQYYEMKTRLPNYIIQRLDRASMSHSLEVRVPFLDHKVLEYCCKIPPSLKMSLFLREKAILRNACAGIIPAEIANRRKRGLEAPVNEWFSMPLPDFARCLLSEKQIADKGYFHPRRVEEILQLQRSGQSVHGFALLRVLLIQMWDEIFLRNRNWTSLPEISPAS
jgi:asparagine synthase (glutamine-hydrolysing)